MRSYQESANRQQLLLTAVYNADCSLLCRITISCLYYKSYSCMRIAYTAVCAALTAMGAHTVSPSSNLHITTHLKLSLYHGTLYSVELHLEVQLLPVVFAVVC